VGAVDSHLARCSSGSKQQQQQRKQDQQASIFAGPTARKQYGYRKTGWLKPPIAICDGRLHVEGGSQAAFVGDRREMSMTCFPSRPLPLTSLVGRVPFRGSSLFPVFCQRICPAHSVSRHLESFHADSLVRLVVVKPSQRLN